MRDTESALLGIGIVGALEAAVQFTAMLLSSGSRANCTIKALAGRIVAVR